MAEGYLLKKSSDFRKKDFWTFFGKKWKFALEK